MSNSSDSRREQMAREMRDEDYAQAMKRQGRRQVFIVAIIVVMIGGLSALPFFVVAPGTRKAMPVTESDKKLCLRIESLHDALNFIEPERKIEKFVRADGATVVRYEFNGTAYGGQKYRLITSTERYADESSANEGYRRGVHRVKQQKQVELGQLITVRPELMLDRSYVAEIVDEPMGITGCLRRGTKVIVFQATPTGLSEQEFISKAAETLRDQ